MAERFSPLKSISRWRPPPRPDRRLSLPRIWTQPAPGRCKKLRRIRAAYEKAREYLSSLLDRETEATSARDVSISWRMGSMAIRADEAGRSRASRQILLFYLRNRSRQRTFDIDQRRRFSVLLNAICGFNRPAQSEVAEDVIACSPFAVKCDDHI